VIHSSDTKPLGGTMRFLKSLLVFVMILSMLLVAVVVLGVFGGFIYLHLQKPHYAGEVSLEGLNAEATVYFDKFGIPHIYGSSEEDVYFALGFVHAQERLFQMEMMRRTAAGRLSEILGPELLETDTFFRTLGLNRRAQQSADLFFAESTQPYQKAAFAYLAGINQYQDSGKQPIEFAILNIPKQYYTPRDIFLESGLIAFGFAHGFRIDPLVTKAYQKLGMDYLKDWVIDWAPGAEKIPVFKPQTIAAADNIGSMVDRIMADLPVPPWIGSNGWVLSPAKTASGKVLLSNDTHMIYAQPSVWFEAHLECPGFSFYGNHAAGIPFAPIGHNRFAAWGLTMFENDDVDFYREKVNPEDPDQVWVDNHWEPFKKRRETIRVKGEEDVIITVRSTRHGPIISDASQRVSAVEKAPVSVWWSAANVQLSSTLASYLFAHVKSMDQAREAAALIDAPGVNVMYGDADGNIAWWASAKLVKRPDHVNSKLFLDGASGKDDPLGWYAFEKNPSSENPPSGFVYSANNQPEAVDGVLYPGYYIPENRARRIIEFLDTPKKWTIKEMQAMSIDTISAVIPATVKEILDTIGDAAVVRKSETHQQAHEILSQWDGGHAVDDAGPVVYYKLLYSIMENAMADELGKEDFTAFVSTHLMKRTTAVFIPNDNSLWWDNITTKNIRETRQSIFITSFDRTVAELSAQLGEDTKDWHWGRVHTIEHGHLLGRKKPLDSVFNVGPFPIMGGNEVLNNLGFKLNPEGQYKVSFGPALRILLDFDDVENSISINPTGQSGHLLSRHYDDQAEMFNSGRFRKQMMNQEEIQATCKNVLRLVPGE